MSRITSLFATRHRDLMIAAAVYVLALVAFHKTLPAVHVWVIAACFSVAMNFTYLCEAHWQNQFRKTEAIVAVALIALSVMGVFLHPLFVIAAIVGHGSWDISKHYGAGVPFLSWYTWSCCAVDFTYGATLLIYWLSL